MTEVANLQITIDARQAEQASVSLEKMATASARAEGRTLALTQQVRSSQAGVQQLGFQINDFGTQLSAGVNPIVAFNQQLGQAGFALSQMGGRLGQVGNFLAGPWGAAVTIGIALLGTMATRLFEQNQALDEGIAKLREDARETENARRAKEAFAQTTEGLYDAIVRLNEVTERSIRSSREAAQATLAEAMAQRARTVEIRRGLEAQLEGQRLLARAQLTSAMQPNQRGEAATQGLAAARRAVEEAEAALSANAVKIEEAQQSVRNATIGIAITAAEETATAVGRINRQYDVLRDRAVAAARGSDALTASLAGTLGRIEANRQAALDLEQQQNRTTRATRERAAAMTEAEREYQSTIRASESLIERLTREADTYGMTETALRRYTASQQIAALAANGWTQEEIALADAIMNRVRAVEEAERDRTQVFDRPDNVTLQPLNIDTVTLLTPIQEAVIALREMDEVAQGLGESLSRSFGRSGQAIGDVVAGITGYRAEVARMFEEAGQNELMREKAFRRQAQMEVQLYGDLAGSAKQFFDEKSTGYQILTAVESAYRAFELASSIASIAQGWTETGQKVAQSTAKTTASTAAGGAKLFEQLGVFAFPVIGAMVAVLAGLGARGGGGGAATPTLPTTNEGRGSVLGDSAAQSASIGNSLDRAERYWARDLQFSNDMVKALRSIDTQIGSVTTAIARELGVGGGLNSSGLGLGTTTSGGFLGIGATTRTTELVDQGIALNGGSLADLITRGVSGNLYQIVQTTSRNNGFLGIGASTRTRNNETTTGLDSGLSGEFSRLLASLRTGVLTAAGVVGVQGAEALLDAFNVQIGRISFDGLSSSEIRERLTAVFSAVGDDLAAAALPGIERFQRAGEGAFETLTRLATEYEAVDNTLRSIGQAFRLVGVESIEARSRLIELSGGLDAFIEGTQAFSEAFLTDAQRIAPIQAAVTAELTRLGIATDISRTGFADLVLGLDVSTAAGAAMYASLINLAPALDQVITYQDELAQSAADAARELADAAAEAAQSAVDAARSDLTQAYEREAGALRDTESRFLSFAKSLAEFRRSLDLDNGIGGMGYGAARGRFNEVASLAALGNEEALGELQGVSQAYLEQSKLYAKDSLTYLRDLSAVKIALQRAEGTATRTASNAQMQLAALDASVAGLITLNTSVLSVRDAIVRLQAALAGQASLSVASTGFGLATGQAGNMAGRDYGNPFNRYLASQTGYMGSFEGGAFEAWIATQNAMTRNAARQAYANFDMIPGFATGGSFTVGGSGGTDTTPVMFRGTPGELVNVSRSDSMAQMAAEVRALRQEMADMRRDSRRAADAAEKTATTLVRVTRDGDSLLTEAA
jgi:hypothetical protein